MASNLYLFDGVDTTDPTTGTFGANNNFDAIQEVVVSNSAISAEYGRAQGAVVNVITKSGTNTFHGSARALVTNDDWNSQNKGVQPDQRTIPSRARSSTRTSTTISSRWAGRSGRTTSGSSAPTSATRNSRRRRRRPMSDLNPPPYTGQSYTQTRTFLAWQGKLSGQITPSHALMFSAQADPFTGIIRNYWNEFGLPAAETAALTAQDQSNDCPWACIWQARYTGVFGSTFSVEATYAQQRGGITVAQLPAGPGSPIYTRRRWALLRRRTRSTASVERPRDQANLAVNIYTQLFGHAHQIKVGVDYQKIKSESVLHLPGQPDASSSPASTPRRARDAAPAGGLVVSGHAARALGLDRARSTASTPSIASRRPTASPSTWACVWTSRTAKSDLGQAVVSATTVSPRLTATYDIFGNGKTLASAAYGVVPGLPGPEHHRLDLQRRAAADRTSTSTSGTERPGCSRRRSGRPATTSRSTRD